MAKTKQQQSDSQALDPETIAAVVLADLAQIEADGETHPDSNAATRILAAVSRLREIATGGSPAD